MKRRLPSILVSALVSLVVWTAGAAAQGATPYPIDAQITALAVTVTHAPLRTPMSDGQDHIEYDLVVTNFMPVPMTLTRVDVLDPGGSVLLRPEGDTLLAATQPLLSSEPANAIPASTSVAIVIDLAVPPGRVLDHLSHRIAYEEDPSNPAPALVDAFQIDGPELEIDSRAAITISPPLRGAGWLNANGCCAADRPHRWVRLPLDGQRIVKSETFAIDWVQLRDGKLFTGDGSRNEDWYGYGAELVAVADGRVIHVRGDMPDESPLQPSKSVTTSLDYGGNQVIIEIERGVYAFYAHLKSGSLAVAVGDHVTAGQVIGLLGNSGNTDGPHLHFGLLDGPHPLVANSIPTVIDEYVLEGMIVAPADDGNAGELPELVPQGPSQVQHGTWPLYQAVTDFSEPGEQDATLCGCVT